MTKNETKKTDGAFALTKFFGAKSREMIRMLAEQDKYIDKAYRRLEEIQKLTE